RRTPSGPSSLSSSPEGPPSSAMGCCVTTEREVPMSSPLETAEHPERLRRVVIEPVTRVEGHGKVTILLDDENRVHQVRLHIVEFRGFERFTVGRPYWELPVMVQRLCGICPVS